MSKRILAVLLALGMLTASSAFANITRLSVLGTGDGEAILGYGGTTLGSTAIPTGGSLYIDDAYNMFYNPALINNYGSMAIIEKAQVSTATNPATQSAAIPTGGFTMGLGMVKIGAFFNRTNSLNPTDGGTIGTASRLRPIDIIVGGELGGAKLGLGFTYASQKYGNTSVGLAATADESFTNTTMKFSLGMDYMGFQPWGYFETGGNRLSTNFTTGQDYGKSTAYGAGLSYKFGEWTPYIAFRQATSTADRTAGAAEAKAVDRSGWGLGIGRNMSVSEGVKFNYAISFWSTGNALTYTGSGSTYQSQNARRIQVPIDVSAEADVTSWMTLRGGVMYRLVDQANTNAGFTAVAPRNGSLNDSTSARLGAGFKIGKVDLDWTVGSTFITGGATTSGQDGSTFGLDGGFFTNASVTYRM